MQGGFLPTSFARFHCVGTTQCPRHNNLPKIYFQRISRILCYTNGKH